MPTPFGWKRQANAAAGVEAFALETGMGAGLVPYVFGSGVTDSGRIATRTRAGAAIAVPDAYSFGEMWELRFTFAETGNSQRQGIFMDVRTSVANSSTIRGMEVSAQSEGNINVGGLTGAVFKAIPRGASGTMTTLYGVQGEVTFNDSAWAGTVTQQAGAYVKVSNEDGGTYTALDLSTGNMKGNIGVLVHNEYITGTVKMDAALAVKATNTTSDSFNAVIDSTGARTTQSDTDKVLLWKFLADNGTVTFMRYDRSDNALVFATS